MAKLKERPIATATAIAPPPDTLAAYDAWKADLQARRAALEADRASLAEQFPTASTEAAIAATAGEIAQIGKALDHAEKRTLPLLKSKAAEAELAAAIVERNAAVAVHDQAAATFAEIEARYNAALEALRWAANRRQNLDSDVVKLTNAVNAARRPPPIEIGDVTDARLRELLIEAGCVRVEHVSSSTPFGLTDRRRLSVNGPEFTRIGGDLAIYEALMVWASRPTNTIRINDAIETLPFASERPTHEPQPMLERAGISMSETMAANYDAVTARVGEPLSPGEKKAMERDEKAEAALRAAGVFDDAR